MVWTAAGYGLWNKYHRKHRVRGEKFKPTDEWEVEPNAHPAIISDVDARAIIAVGRERTKVYERGRRKEQASPYLLSGDNAQGTPLFICGVCGSRMIGSNPGGRNRRKYTCSTKMYKGADHCRSTRIDTERLERAVLDVLRQRFTREYMLAVIRAANEEIRRQRHAVRQVTDVREVRLREIEVQLKRIRDSILAGIDPAVWADESKRLAKEKAELEASLAAEPPKQEQTAALEPIPEDRAEELARRVAQALAESATLDERKRIVKTLVQQMTLTSQGIVYLELTPDPLDLNAPTLYAMSGDKLVPPTGFEPVFPP